MTSLRIQHVIDVTTQNSVYNPTTAQGQWFQHRWGKRSYPTLDIDFNWIIKNLDPQLKYDLHSVYGDPICWCDLVDFVEWCNTKPEIFTYGNSSNVSVFKELNKHRAYTVVKIDGINELCGKVYLGAQWKNILSVLSAIEGFGGVELQVYDHNCHQIPRLFEICNQHQLQLFLCPGVKNDEFGTSIIDTNCNWLYDVVPCNLGIHLVDHDNIDIIKQKLRLKERSNLSKNLWAYKSLRTYMPVKKHRSILEKPLLGNIGCSDEIVDKFLTEYQQKEGTFITPDMQIFWNHKVYTMYMYLLANDWKLDNSYLRENKDNYFVSEVLLYAKYIIADVIQQKL